ncbi:MAG: hypothetical protein DCF28_01595, partial [Alphaproteobacteria bacterium]
KKAFRDPFRGLRNAGVRCSSHLSGTTSLNRQSTRDRLELSGVAAALPLPDPNGSSASLKAFEDMLDAVICAWVGVQTLKGKALPYGDEQSAIWIPVPFTGP